MKLFTIKTVHYKNCMEQLPFGNIDFCVNVITNNESKLANIDFKLLPNKVECFDNFFVSFSVFATLQLPYLWSQLTNFNLVCAVVKGSVVSDAQSIRKLNLTDFRLILLDRVTIQQMMTLSFYSTWQKTLILKLIGYRPTSLFFF